MHSLYGALPIPYVPVHVTHDARLLFVLYCFSLSLFCLLVGIVGMGYLD